MAQGDRNQSVFDCCSILSASNWREKTRRKAAANSSHSSAFGSPPSSVGGRGVRGLLGEESSGTWGGRKGKEKAVARHQFDVSVGQDVVDRENSLKLVQSQERNRDLLEHSYSSLSDHHSNRQ